MATIKRTLTDIPPEQVETQKGLLEADGFAVIVQQQPDGLVTLVGTKDDGNS
jgi:hypothetical protein